MSNKVGADFSNVKVHSDSKAADMNSSIGAKAFTHGKDIYFNKGQYNPSSQGGKHLLAHELTHTVQQGAAEMKEEKDKGASILQMAPEFQKQQAEDVSPEEQPHLKKEFELYAEYKLQVLDQKINDEKDDKVKKKQLKARDKFKKKKNRFIAKMDKGEDWGTSKYARKLKNKFEDYTSRGY